jgi:hypothetical protein
MKLQAILTACIAAGAAAFNFGGFNIPIPSIPGGLFPTALPSIPPIPSAIVDLPPDFLKSLLPETSIPDFSMPAIPTIDDQLPIGSRIPMISLPPIPSIDISSAFPSIRPIPSDVAGAIATRLIDINKGLESAGFSRLPTIPADPVGVFASLRGAVASLRDQLGDGRDGLQKLVDSYLNTTQRNFTVPASEAELKEILENRGGFDMSRADAILDDLGSKTGQDIRGSIRMISALVFKNFSTADGAANVFSRVTQEFTYHSARIREGAEQAFNFSGAYIRLPSLPNFQNKTLSVIQYASNPYQFISGQRLNSQVVSIMVADLAGNETAVRDLADVIRFTLPLNVTDAEYTELLGSGRAACVYWEEATAAWQTDGCSLIDLLPTEAHCACTHLTDFAVSAVIPVASPVFAVQMPSPTMAPLAASLTASSAVLPESASGRPGIILAVGGAATETTSAGGVPTTTIVGAALGGFLAVGAIALIAANIVHYRRKEQAKLALKSIRTVSPIASKPAGWV